MRLQSETVSPSILLECPFPVCSILLHPANPSQDPPNISHSPTVQTSRGAPTSPGLTLRSTKGHGDRLLSHYTHRPDGSRLSERASGTFNAPSQRNRLVLKPAVLLVLLRHAGPWTRHRDRTSPPNQLNTLPSYRTDWMPSSSLDITSASV